MDTENTHDDIKLLEAAGLGDLPQALHATYAATMKAKLEEHVGGALLLILSVTQEAELILAADESAAVLDSYLDANLDDYPEVVREETRPSSRLASSRHGRSAVL